MAEENNTNLSKIDLHKKNVAIVLERKNLQGRRAKVGLALDITGSMQPLYKNGTVQRVVERVLALASQFDDNGELDIWIYDHRFKRMPSVNEKEINGYVDRVVLVEKEKFGHNFECLVMEDIVKTYIGQGNVDKKLSLWQRIIAFIKGLFGIGKKPETGQKAIEYPAFVIFISDGGCKNSGGCMEKIITESSKHSLFWQFIGIGKGKYGVLEKLDNLRGRSVDNSDFFNLDDIDTIADDELYNRLLGAFPQWLGEAKKAGILK